VGVVSDVSNAVVDAATVTLTDTATRTSRTTTSNSTGRYIFVDIAPGNYDLTVSKQGFSTTKTQVTVQVGLGVTVNLTMKVGGGSTVVEVTAAGTELQTLNSTIGNTVTARALENLPTLGRDTSSFVTMQAGVSPDGSAAGTVVDQTVFTLDGGNNSNDMDGSSGVYNPNFGDDPAGGLFSNKYNQISGSNLGINGGQPSGVIPTPVDSVEEFKVSTTNQTADFNNSSGMQVAIVTKRGTNTWHGTVYEYYWDNNFSGNTWENNLTGTPVPDWHRSWFGVAVGGPIIPKEILGSKTYFFFNYQGMRWPGNSETLTRLVPSADMRNGILHDSSCPGGTCDMTALDPRGIGINSYIQQMWNQYMPLSNTGSTSPCGALTGDGFCDGVNTLAFSANLVLPQNDNFAVVRLDHDFGQKWHFQSSYRYYHLTRATDDQVDIGGFFSGDTLGTPKSLTNRPQVPWYLVLGMTTNINSHLTNDFRYSFLRNWWQWGSNGDPAQFSALGAALEPFGEERYDVAAPYNVNTQQTRTRFWDGKDQFLRDDVSWLKGGHLMQFGGQYQHNWNYHQRTDNGAGINYYPVYLLGDPSGAGNVDMTCGGTCFTPAFSGATLAREAAAVLGIVTDSQQAYTYSGSGGNLTLNPPLTPASDKSTIPYYNLYFNDTWHLKPSLTVTYGLGWALEMPPSEQNGRQIMFTGPDGRELDTQTYLADRKAAALDGQVYNPTIGFALIGNVVGHPSHFFDPFYHAFSPRVAAAWNPGFAKNTVIRGGYGRIYGRLNGVGLVLVPLLSPGLIEAVSCSYAFSNGTCGTSGPIDATSAFRIGTDGTMAPLPAATPTLAQPLFPGVNGVEAATASPQDPRTRPNSVDSFDLTIQRQFTNKISLEVGGISRWIHKTLLSDNLNSVPYMMTLGGQQFKTAYANIEKAMGCATSIGACAAATPSSTLTALGGAQPFFEAALAGTNYFGCTSGNCTAALINDPTAFGLLQGQSVWALWSYLDNGGAKPGFNFPLSTMSSAGQMVSNVAMATSLGHGNYNGAFATLKIDNWKGITFQNNLTWSKALGTGDVVQATSGQVSVDPFNPDEQYGVQPSDRKLVETMLLVYDSPFYRDQHGLMGHVLGGWTPSFVFAAGSGAPLFCTTSTGYAEEGYSGGGDFGSADGIYINTDANCVLTGSVPSMSFHSSGLAFADPAAVNARLRPLILGVDSRSGGYGQFRGLPYWNLNFAVKKNVRITERFNLEGSVNVNNFLNHNQMLDPILSMANPITNPAGAASFGAFAREGTLPRAMEMGIRINF
jgi:hypothetical protein